MYVNVRKKLFLLSQVLNASQGAWRSVRTPTRPGESSSCSAQLPWTTSGPTRASARCWSSCRRCRPGRSSSRWRDCRARRRRSRSDRDGTVATPTTSPSIGWRFCPGRTAAAAAVTTQHPLAPAASSGTNWGWRCRRCGRWGPRPVVNRLRW